MIESKDAGVELAPPPTDILTTSNLDAGAPAGASCVIDHPVVVTAGLAEQIAGCRLGHGFQMVMYYSDGNLEERQPSPRGKKHGGSRMADESKIVEAEEAAGVDSALPAAVEAETSGAGALTVQPDVPASAVQDVQKIMEQAGGANGYAVLLSLIAVAGGGAGWKFYQSFAKQRHEQKMKQLEIEQSKAEKQDDSHKQCDAKNAALAVQIDALSSKLTELQEQVSPQQGGAELGVGFSGEDLENLDKRLKALENWKKRGAKK